MADKEFTLRATREAATAIDGLRGRVRKSYEAFEAEPGAVIIVALDRHDDRAFYVDLATTLEIGAAGRRRQEKPACCGADGWPSVGSTPAGRQGRARRNR